MSSIVLNPSGQPASPQEGEVYYDSTADKLKVRDASAFREVVTQDATFNGTLGSGVTGFGVIRNAQEFRIQGEFDGSAVTGTVLGSGTPSANVWEENDTDYSRHGVSIWSQSSGVFTCSVTGIFLCTWCVSVSDSTSADKFDPNIQIDSGSGYATRAKVWGHTNTTPFAMPVGNTFMFKVTNTSDFKLRVRQSEENDIGVVTHIQGATDVSYTNIVFLRLGDV